MSQITLTNEEMLSAVIIGARRLLISKSGDFKNIAGAIRGWDNEIEGAMAEVATSKMLGVYFDPSVGRYKSKDVSDFHVRHTELEKGCLIIRKGDPEGKYLLVTGRLGCYVVRGWIDSQQAREMNDCKRAPEGRPEAWFIPQERLERL